MNKYYIIFQLNRADVHAVVTIETAWNLENLNDQHQMICTVQNYLE